MEIPAPEACPLTHQLFYLGVKDDDDARPNAASVHLIFACAKKTDAPQPFAERPVPGEHTRLIHLRVLKPHQLQKGAVSHINSARLNTPELGVKIVSYPSICEDAKCERGICLYSQKRPGLKSPQLVIASDEGRYAVELTHPADWYCRVCGVFTTAHGISVTWDASPDGAAPARMLQGVVSEAPSSTASPEIYQWTDEDHAAAREVARRVAEHGAQLARDDSMALA